MALFFGLQSLQAYAVFGWFAALLVGRVPEGWQPAQQSVNLYQQVSEILLSVAAQQQAQQPAAQQAEQPPDDVPTLEAIELDVLGRKGRLTSVLRGIGGLPADDRPRPELVQRDARLHVLGKARSLDGNFVRTDG